MTSAAGRLVAEAAVSDDARATIIVVTVGVMVITGLIVIIVHRFGMKGATGEAASSMTRPVLAILIVGTVLILAGASLGFSDAQTRNLLLGGVVSLSSAAVAFYFASTGASEARKDLLTATAANAQVPDLSGKSATEAEQIVSGTHLMLVLPDPRPDDDARVTDQEPKPGTIVRIPASVRAIF